jgi:hypothetical protein
MKSTRGAGFTWKMGDLGDFLLHTPYWVQGHNCKLGILQGYTKTQLVLVALACFPSLLLRECLGTCDVPLGDALALDGITAVFPMSPQILWYVNPGVRMCARTSNF